MAARSSVSASGKARSLSEATDDLVGRMDFRAEYEAMGVEITGGSPSPDGWLYCMPAFREGRKRSQVAINLQTGAYKDHSDKGDSWLSFWDFCLKCGSQFGSTLNEVKSHFAGKYGVEWPTGKGKKRANPEEQLEFFPWVDELTRYWLYKKPGISLAGLKAFGARRARYKNSITVFAIPVWGPELDASPPVGWVVFDVMARDIPIRHVKDGPVEWVKMQTTFGSSSGIMGDVSRIRSATRIIKPEGPTDGMALESIIPDEERATTAIITNSAGANENPSGWVLGLFKDKEAWVVHDCDLPGQGNPAAPNPGGAIKWTKAISAHASEVKNLLISEEIAEKHGFDLRDWVAQGHQYSELIEIASGSSASTAKELTPNEAPDDPHRLARVYIRDHAFDFDSGLKTICFWRDVWYRWDGMSYQKLSKSQLRAEVISCTKREVDRINLIEQADEDRDGEIQCRKITSSLVTNVIEAIQGECYLSSQIEAPAWIEGDPRWPATEMFATASCIVHLPSYAGRAADAEQDDYSIPPTPAFFSFNAVPYSFHDDCDEPDKWFKFLRDVWDDDMETIDTLQEWFGYCLLPDTQHHKILMMIGPPRSGKGTCGRLLEKLIGKQNVANPKMSSFADTFGTTQLIGKTLAIFPDARLSGRTDAIAIVETLLSISGEDAQTIDRKFLEHITVRLPTRFMILSNELPSLRDASGALASRLIVLRTTKNMIGKEDKALDNKLAAELPGILRWAIEGWERLRARGHFVQPESAKDMLSEFHSLSSPIHQFIEEVCVVDHNGAVDIEELYDHWKQWCQQEGRENIGTKSWFGRDLMAAVPSISKFRPEINGVRRRFYQGISLRSTF